MAFECLVFGKVAHLTVSPIYSALPYLYLVQSDAGNCIATLECLEEPGIAPAVNFGRQIDVIMGTIGQDELFRNPVHLSPGVLGRALLTTGQSTQVCMPVNNDQPMSPYDGCLTIETHTLAGECCVFYAGNSNCTLSLSSEVVEVGTWIVALASLQRYNFDREDRVVRSSCKFWIWMPNFFFLSLPALQSDS